MQNSYQQETLIDPPLVAGKLETIFGATPTAGEIPEFGVHHGWSLKNGSPVPLKDWPMVRAVERGETVLGETYAIRRYDESRAKIILSAVPLHSAEGEVIGGVAVAQDITELHRLQKEKEEYNHTISHDLRIPLTVILGHAQLLQERITTRKIDGELRLSVDAIEKGAERMNDMIRTLSDTARLESGQVKAELEALDLAAYLKDLLERCAIALQIERIRVEISAEIPRVLADPFLLERILLNLLTNALKYSANGSEVSLTARAEEEEAVIRICDRGPGIDPDALSRLFTRFYRVDPGKQKEGLGLGLYISRQLVEIQGGRIWAESTKGQGSEFCVALHYAGSEDDQENL